MAKDPAFPFYASDWLGSNKRATMTLEQQGAYLLLLCRQWSDPTCSLPDDDGALAGLSELGEGWLTIGCPSVRDCFPKHPELEGRLANPKLLELRAERDDWRAKSRKGGKKSGATRRAKARGKKGCGHINNLEPKANQRPTTPPTKCEPNANTPSPSPSPSNSVTTNVVTHRRAAFVRPTIEEVTAYCQQRKNRIDPQQFIDHYESNGWRVGKNPMKDWRAAVRTWEKNDLRKGNQNAQRPPDPSRVQAEPGKYDRFS